jgi:hypothetical protein
MTQQQLPFSTPTKAIASSFEDETHFIIRIVAVHTPTMYVLRRSTPLPDAN